MTEREALKLALEKFEHLWEIGIDAEYKVELLPEINAIKEALAQPEQKPVAWLYIEPDNTYLNVHYDDVDESQFPYDEWFPVYKSTPQRTWVGLTDEEIQYCVELKNPEAIAEEIEAKLKEKNT